MDSQVYMAAKLGDITIFREVVMKEESRLMGVTPQGNTMLHVSASFGSLNFVDEVYVALLKYNTSLEGNTDYSRSLSLLRQVNLEGDTALHVAIREGHTSVAEFLIKMIMPWICEPSDHDLAAKDISHAYEAIRMRNEKKNTALHEAVQRNDVKMVEVLIKVDCDLRHPNYEAEKEGGASPLFLAARRGCLDIINKILNACPSAAHNGPKGRTAAAVGGNLDVVKALLEKNREWVHTVDENGRTALHYAAWGGRTETVRYLLEYDTSGVYKWDKEGLSAIHIAALKSSTSVLEELIKRCPDSLEVLDNTKQRHVLHYAVMSKDLDKVQYVTRQPEFKKLINHADKDGNTPFHVAAKQGSVWLIQHFALGGRVDVVDLNAKNNRGQTVADVSLYVNPTLSDSFIAYFSMKSMSFFLCKWLSALRKSQRALGEEEEEEWIIGIPDKEQTNEQDEKEKAAKALEEQKKMMKNLQIVASLIATMNFVAVFQVPGGYNSGDGKPMLGNKKSFQLFLASDAAAMCASVASLVMFVIASVISSYPYAFITFVIGASLLSVSLIFTSIAFVEGFRAVLPHCSNFLCFSGPQPIQTYSKISLSATVIMLGSPIMCILFYFFYKAVKPQIMKNHSQ